MEGEPARKLEAHIRRFQGKRDAKDAAAILREAREATSWSEPDLEELDSLTGFTAYVAEAGNRVSGIVVGRTVLGEAEILNLAVRPGVRRQGEGRKLMQRLLEEFREKGVSRVFLEVRESNAGAITFYEKLGFQATGKRKDYYQEPNESAVLMELPLKNPQVSVN